MGDTKKGVDHIQALAKILDILSKNNMWLKPDRCEFLRFEVEYLGLKIAHNRIWIESKLQLFIGFENF